MKKYIAVAAAILVFASVAAFGAGDFNKPSGSSLRTNFMAEIRDMFADQAVLFSGTSTTHYPTNTVRYNSSNKRFEKYNGSTWPELDLTGSDPGEVSFSAKLTGGAVTLTSGVASKIAFSNEDFDVGGYFDSATNYRFTPPAGRYILTLGVSVYGTGALGELYVTIRKNGADFKQVRVEANPGSAIILSMSHCVSAVATANGTDYFEGYVYSSGTATIQMDPASSVTFFTGAKVK